jgi:hypothetical protein
MESASGIVSPLLINLYWGTLNIAIAKIQLQMMHIV